MNNEKNTYDITFIDFLFTVSILVGFMPETLNINNKSYSYKGIFSENWVINGALPTNNEIISIISFVLCFLTVGLSWFGYHKTIKTKNNSTSNGISNMIRFILDIFLVFLYTLLLIKFQDYNFITTLIMIIFFFYTLWDLVLIIEYLKERKLTGTKNSDFILVYRRRLNTLIYLIILIVLKIIYINFHQNILLLLLLYIVIVVLYRINKMICIWEHLFGIHTINEEEL